MHFSDKLRLDSLEIVTQDVVQDNLMQLADQLKDRMTRIFVDKSSHSCVFQILQLVAQMDRIDHLRVLNRDGLLIFHFAFQEVAEICLLSKQTTELIRLLEVIVVAVASSVAIW